MMALWIEKRRFRNGLAGLLALTAVGLMIAAAETFRQFDCPALDGFLFMLAGGAVLAASLRVLPQNESLPAVASAFFNPLQDTHYFLAGVGALLLALLAVVNIAPPELAIFHSVTTHAQFALLCAGVALVALGLGGFDLPLRRANLNRGELLAVGAITMLALGLRFWQLDAVRVLVDELNFVTAIQYVRADPYVKLLEPFSSIAAFPYLFPYWQASAVEVFGRSFVGLRAVSAIVGALSVPAVYVLGRSLFDRRAALVAALLLAAFPPHLNFSRIGINNIADPLFGALALAFLGRGMLSGRRSDYALGGVMLGLTQYFYEGGRLLFPALAVVWLVGVGLFRRHYIRLDLRRVGVTALAAGLVALPVYLMLGVSGAPAAARLNTRYVLPDADYWNAVMSPGGLQAHLENHVLPAFLINVRLPDTSLFYGGRDALLLPALVTAFLSGLFYALWRARQPGFLLLVLWVGGVWLANSLLLDSRQSPRYVVSFPAVALLAAIGITRLAAVIVPGWQKPQAMLIVTLAAGLAFVQADYYFNDHLPFYNRQFREVLGYRDGQDAVLRSLGFPPSTQIHIISSELLPGDYIGGLLHFMNDSLQLDILLSDDVTPAVLQQMAPGVDHAFYVEVDDARLINLLHDHFFLRPPEFSPYGLLASEQFALYYAPYVPGLSEERLQRGGG
ncbi:MAG: glycosyltransferase family 39 protein [Chloroflexi bacterium]|nr:glycosyltransferase family 39 protein [Chloroflexota bacterium]